MSDPRPLRLCDICGELDDHPRHVQTLAPDAANVPSAEFLDALGDVPAKALAQILAPHTVIRHMNCCADAGCELCQSTEAEHGGVRGAELIAAVLASIVTPTESESI